MKQGILNTIQEKTGLPRLNHKAGIFLVCLGIAIVFWVFTALNKEYETAIRIPVSYRNIPFTSQNIKTLPSYLEFHFKGRGFDLAAIHAGKIPDSISIDVGNAAMGQKIVSSVTLIGNQLAWAQKKIAPYRLVPDSIRFNFKNRNSKLVPVNGRGFFSYKRQYHEDHPVVLKPDSIEIAGPLPLLDKITYLNTEVFYQRKLDHTVFAATRLINPYPGELELSQPFVYYYASVAEFTEGAFDIPIQLPLSMRNQITIYPSKVKVIFQASIGDYSKIHAEDFTVEPVLKDPGSQLPPRIDLFVKKSPRQAKMIKLEPESVDYLIQN